MAADFARIQGMDGSVRLLARRHLNNADANAMIRRDPQPDHFHRHGLSVRRNKIRQLWFRQLYRQSGNIELARDLGLR